MERLEERCLLSATLVRDINTAGVGSDPTGLTAVGERVFFRAITPATGRELHVSNGTAEGTHLVRDINPGLGDSNLNDPTAVGDRLFFTVSAVGTGTKLWVSDGTAEGTRIVLDPVVGPAVSGFTNLTAVGDRLFFNVSAPGIGTELWVSDGTAEGTVLVRDVNPGPASFFLNALTAVGGQLFFMVLAPDAGRQLWASDGTAEGTVLVRDFTPSPGGTFPIPRRAVGDRLFFVVTTPTTTRQLWVSDGTPEGTRLLIAGLFPDSLMGVGGRLFFTAQGPGAAFGLWVSDGTAEGTTLVRDFSIGTPTTFPASLTGVGGRLFFTATNSTAGRELWSSDGTTKGTALVRDIFPGLDGSSPSFLTAAGGRLYFAATEPVAGTELWGSDGTEEGTVLVRDVNPSTAGSVPEFLTPLGGRLFFRAFNRGSGRELWASDGTGEGARLVRDINPGSADSDPANLTVMGNRLFFTATEPATGTELWVSDGTPEGTRLVRDINPGPARAFEPFRPVRVAEVGGRLFFTAVTPETGQELWVSDGTPEGTRLVRDINPGPAGAFDPFSPTNLTVVGGRLFFTATAPGVGQELWVSDGTEEGTRLVRDINPGPAGAFDMLSAGDRAVLGGRLFFLASEPRTGRELWVSDGTPEGTRLVRDINPGPASGFEVVGSLFAASLTVLGDRLFFTAITPETGQELWVSDGTPEGTRLVRDINPGSAHSSPRLLTALGGALYFAAFRADTGRELWVSDGTAEETTLVRDINPGPAGTFVDPFLPANLTVVGSRLFFTTEVAGTGRELWVSDGTAEGTALVRDINPGPASAFDPVRPANLAAVGGRLLFTALAPDTGRELWVTDGTLEGTTLVRDINPGPASAIDQFLSASLTVVGGRLFFVAADDLHGREVWGLPPARVERIAFDDGSPRRSRLTRLTVTFSGVVTLQPGAFLLVAEDGAPVALDVAESVVDGKTVVVLTPAGGPLPDGNYALVIRADRVRDCLGDPLDGDGDGEPGGDQVEYFLLLLGDNGDVDLPALRQN